MAEVETQVFSDWKNELELSWREIPKPFQNDYTVRRTLQCALYGYLKKMSHRVVADYLPPRIQDRAVDLIALNDQREIVYAVCLESVVTLAAVKSLSSFEAAHKIIFTTGLLETKVQESRFFLKPDIHHIHLRAGAKK